MTVKLASLKTDTAAEIDGALIPIPDWEGVVLHVRGFDYSPFRTARALLLQKIQRKYKSAPSADRDDELYRGFGTLYADHILLGWQGFDQPYTRELAADCLPLKEWKALHAAVEYAAGQVAKIEAEYVEDAAKN